MKILVDEMPNVKGKCLFTYRAEELFANPLWFCRISDEICTLKHDELTDSEMCPYLIQGWRTML